MDWMNVVDLVKDAEINLLIANGSGLGAVLLAVVSIVFIVRLRNPDGVFRRILRLRHEARKEVPKK